LWGILFQSQPCGACPILFDANLNEGTNYSKVASTLIGIGNIDTGKHLLANARAMESSSLYVGCEV